MNKWKIGEAPTMRDATIMLAVSFVAGFALLPVLNTIAGN